MVVSGNIDQVGQKEGDGRNGSAVADVLPYGIRMAYNGRKHSDTGGDFSERRR